jgi:tetraacyldisaccharide 4'-kinase
MTGFRHIQRPALIPLSLCYGLVVIFRNWLFDLRILPSVRFKLPVISIGNITVGGTGKTPHVEFLIKLLKNDYRLAVLSRGYKRKTNKFILATTKSGVTEIGDEPLQIKLKFPDVNVAVECNRVKGVKTLIESIHKLELVILDDAFQHRYIQPGLSVLLVDYNRPVFQDMLLPAGNLREPRQNAKRADIIIVTKCPGRLSPHERADFISNLHPVPGQKIYFTKYNYGNPVPVFPDKHGRQEIVTYKHLHKTGTGVLLVTGIANPEPLRKFLHESIHIDKELTFPDHHNYNLQDLKLIRSTLKTIAAEEKYILVTEKDAVRLKESEPIDKNFKKAFYYIPVEVNFLAKGEKPFIKRIYKFLKKSGRK